MHLEDDRHEFETRLLPRSLTATLAALPSMSLINLAHGYLLDNQFDKAKTIYLESKAYKQSVLDDLEQLEEAGITYPDMEKIKTLLNGTVEQ